VGLVEWVKDDINGYDRGRIHIGIGEVCGNLDQALLQRMYVRVAVAETLDDVWRGYSGPIPGTVRPRLKWKIEKIS